MLVAGVGLVGDASATLIDRGNGLIYDNVLNITWVQNASLCVTLNNCVNRNDTIVSGGMNWGDATTWAANLVYQGFDDWRLPYASVAAGAGPSALPSGFVCTGSGGADESACRNNEMAYMFYYNLNGNPGDDKTHTQTSVDGITFTNIQAIHWSGTAANTDTDWTFRFFVGDQLTLLNVVPLGAWPVRPGDVGAVSAVPEPSGVLLLGTGILALGLARRRERQR